jgi:hypothetical protein
MGKVSKPQAPAPVAPAPTVMETEPASESAVKKERRKSGYQSTLLTGSLSPSTGKKTVLG